MAFANTLSLREGLTPAYAGSGSGLRWNREANGYRLLTEAEWEHAARGGRSGQRYAGTDDPAVACRFANVADAAAKAAFGWTGMFDCTDGYAGLAPVGSLSPNGYGLRDMTGNVWEWVWDFYGADPSRTVSNPRGPESATYRVIRGGSWDSYPRFARVADRSRGAPGYRIHFVGLRLARPAR